MTGGKSKKRQYTRRDRKVVVFGERREVIDIHKLSRAVIALAQAQLEADARRANETPDPENPQPAEDRQ